MKLLKSCFTLVLAQIAFSAHALPLNEYNLILFEDYNFEGGDVEGKAFIGGDLNATGYGVVAGSKAPSVGDTLTVKGNITATNLTIENGDLVHGGTLNVGNLNMNGGGSVRQDSSLDITSIYNQLDDASATYKAMAANGYFDQTSKTLQYNGSDEVAVFNVDASEVFAMNTSLKLDSGSADKVIINVTGENITAGGGTNLVDGFRHDDIGASNIMWNFSDAKYIDFTNLAMFGSIVAIDADITGGAVFDGAVAAKSYTGAREFHNYLAKPPKTTDVPEPSTLAIFGLGVIGMALRRRTLV